MKNKNHLVQMELLVMVLVFALSAAVCLQVFAFSHHLSNLGCARDRAVLEAQSAAEILKSTQGNLERAAERMGGSCDESGWHICYDGDFCQTEKQEVYRLTVTPKETEQNLLGMAEIEVETEAGECLLCLECAWQEVA